MHDSKPRGRVTIPTDIDVIPQTKELLARWGADAIRDCDGTDFPQELKDTGAKVYATYYTTRKDNAWAKTCLLYTSPSPRDRSVSRMPSSA